MVFSRRKFLTGASAGLIIAAPAIVAIGNIMPVKSHLPWYKMYTLEIQQSLEAYHGLDAEHLLAQILREEIFKETYRDIIPA